jgi:hypothetical protein
MLKNLHLSFAAVTRLPSGQCLGAQLMLKVKNYLICLVDTLIKHCPWWNRNLYCPWKHK